MNTMRKLFFLLLAVTIFSCSTDDDSIDDVVIDESVSTFKIEFSKNGNTDEWYDELEFKTSPDGWVFNDNTTSNGDLQGTEVANDFTITSKSKMEELTITYYTTPYFDGTNFLDNSEPTFLNVTIKVYEDNELIDTQTLNLDGSVQATKDFEFNYIVD